MAKKEIKNNKNIKNNKDKTSFFKSFKAELKKVIWPTPKQLFNNTVAVLVIVLITAAIVFLLDLTFESINKYGIDKVKESISNTAEENTTVENNISTEENSVIENIVEDNVVEDTNSITAE